jgi:hypothetical protein
MEAVDIKLPDDSKTFADKIILLMADVSGKITLQQYKSCVSKNTLFFQSLGLIFDTGTCVSLHVPDTARATHVRTTSHAGI